MKLKSKDSSPHFLSEKTAQMEKVGWQRSRQDLPGQRTQPLSSTTETKQDAEKSLIPEATTHCFSVSSLMLHPPCKLFLLNTVSILKTPPKKT